MADDKKNIVSKVDVEESGKFEKQLNTGNVSIDDDEDVSDLDDVLDDFSNPPPSQKPAKVSVIRSKEKSGEIQDKDVNDEKDDDEGLDEDFTAQLSAGMEKLMREFSGEIDVTEDNASESKTEMTTEEMNKMLEDTFGQFLNMKEKNKESVDNVLPSSSTSTSSGPNHESGFQDQIKATLDKLKNSSENVNSEVSDAASSDMLQQLMTQMPDLEDSEGFQNLLEGMMEQLMSKDVLYEPMKDLDSKFPDYLEKNKETLSKEEFQRYEKQYGYIKQIILKFESQDFDESNEEHGKFIVELMQKMQDCGAPPSEIMGEGGQGFELDENGIPKLPTGVNPEDCAVM